MTLHLWARKPLEAEDLFTWQDAGSAPAGPLPKRSREISPQFLLTCWPARTVAKGDRVRSLQKGGPEPHGTRLAWRRGDDASVTAKPVTDKPAWESKQSSCLRPRTSWLCSLHQGTTLPFRTPPAQPSLLQRNKTMSFPPQTPPDGGFPRRHASSPDLGDTRTTDTARHTLACWLSGLVYLLISVFRERVSVLITVATVADWRASCSTVCWWLSVLAVDSSAALRRKV